MLMLNETSGAISGGCVVRGVSKLKFTVRSRCIKQVPTLGGSGAKTTGLYQVDGLKLDRSILGIKRYFHQQIYQLAVKLFSNRQTAGLP